jgi:hypothetical protein
MAEETAAGVADVWRGHVRAWQQPGMSRNAYCLEHGLDVWRFHCWVGRLRGEFRRPVGQQPRRGRSAEKSSPRHTGAGGGEAVDACEGGGAAVTAGDGGPGGFVPVTVIDEDASPPAEERPPAATEGAEGRPPVERSRCSWTAWSCA